MSSSINSSAPAIILWLSSKSGSDMGPLSLTSSKIRVSLRSTFKASSIILSVSAAFICSFAFFLSLDCLIAFWRNLSKDSIVALRTMGSSHCLSSSSASRLKRSSGISPSGPNFFLRSSINLFSSLKRPQLNGLSLQPQVL